VKSGGDGEKNNGERGGPASTSVVRNGIIGAGKETARVVGTDEVAQRGCSNAYSMLYKPEKPLGIYTVYGGQTAGICTMEMSRVESGKLAAIRVEQADDGQRVIPETRGELAVKEPRDEAEAWVFPRGNARRHELEPVWPCCGILVGWQVGHCVESTCRCTQ
jgi:hypothetical protein